MVRKSPAIRLAAALALAVCLALLLAGLCLAQADGEKPTINEEYRVTINSLGDGHVVDTIRYSADDYKEVKKVESKKRGFLTRRFKSDDNTGEVLSFKTRMDDAKRSVVITYDKPGYVYNEKGTFAIYGVDREPKKEADRLFRYEEKSYINSEFTLFTDQVILAKYVYELPSERPVRSRREGDKVRDAPGDGADGLFQPEQSHPLGGLRLARAAVRGRCSLRRHQEDLRSGRRRLIARARGGG